MKIKIVPYGSNGRYRVQYKEDGFWSFWKEIPNCIIWPIDCGLEPTIDSTIFNNYEDAAKFVARLSSDRVQDIIREETAKLNGAIKQRKEYRAGLSKGSEWYLP